MSIIDNLINGLDSVADTLFAPLASHSNHESPADHAGELAAFVTQVNDGEENIDGSITISGVVIPKLVADQLKKLGTSLAFFNTGQLKAAIDGCAIDCTLIDDPNGDSFFDGLELDASEMNKDAVTQKDETPEIDEDLLNHNFLNRGHGAVFEEPPEATGHPFYTPKFREKIKSEREQKKRGLSGEEGSAEQHVSHFGS